MSEKVFNSPEELVSYFKDNERVLADIPWGLDLISHWKSINKGCSCKKKARIENVNAVYKDLVINVFGKSEMVSNILKKDMGVESITFKLNDEVLTTV